MNLPRLRIPLAASIAAVFLVGVAVGRAPFREATRPVRSPAVETGDAAFPTPLSTKRVREVWEVLHAKFAGPLDDADLATGALRGIAAGTGDPYTSYADPAESKQFEADLSGSFTGIGVEIGLRRGLVTVIAPLRGSPAERAGIRAQDSIVKVDGTAVDRTLTLTEVVAKIRGPVGTEVRLTVAREGAEDVLEFTVRRARIQIESVKLEIENQVGIVTLSAFNDDTDRRFRRIASELLAARVRGILLDLRNNPGGLLEQAVNLAGHFLPQGTLVVTEVPRDERARTEHFTDGPSDLARLPVVVLVNGGSASAAEILAAALHDQRGVPLVGEQTFGKGSVQELVDLSDGSSLRVTVARWHTPKGQEIGEDGVAPTVAVEDPDVAKDPDEILNKAVEVLEQETAGGR